MINLYLLCSDLKNNQSEFKHKSNYIISDIYRFCNRSTEKTQLLYEGWKENFKYIYGDINTNLSSNSKLNKPKLFAKYDISYQENDENDDALLFLFFSIQTYFSLLTKFIMRAVLQGISEKDNSTHEDLILGRFADEYGIKNYCYEDWYSWPVFELNNGFEEIITEIETNIKKYSVTLSIDEFQSNNNYDFIKQIYESIIPKELRHALGEYYTPDWLAEITLKNTITSHGESVHDISIIDPTCGSGTFLFKAIALKRKAGCSLSEILKSVKGLDINPLAVLTAKTNYLLSILDLIDGKTAIEIPVYNTDIIEFASVILPQSNQSSESFLKSDDPVQFIRDRIQRDRITATSLEESDIVVGNPPWVNWEYMPEQYRKDSQHLWIDYNLFCAKGRDLSFSKEDISVLITYIVLDKLLKHGGVLGFVIRQGVFKSAQNGVGFRRFMIKDETPVKVLKVEDLSKIRAFENANNSTALFFAKKNEQNTYPISYYLWEKRKDLQKCSFGAYSQLQEVLSQITVKEQHAIPSNKHDDTSLWVTADCSSLDSMKKILGENDYRARTGVFTGGANAVYWLNINENLGDTVLISNIVERAKRKSEQVIVEIEKEHVYPMLKGSNVRKWNVRYDTYLLCPHTAETKMWPVPQNQLAVDAPQTLRYLTYFKEDLDGRNGFAGWEKDIQRQEFHSILRIGDYTFSKYKVIWKYIATEFVCAVISTVDDMYLGKKILLPNEKIMYVSFDDEDEAYYLCGLLSSTLVANCVNSYMNPTSISAHVLNKLNIPHYDPTNALHTEISRICKSGHGKNNIEQYIEQIDDLVAQIYMI